MQGPAGSFEVIVNTTEPFAISAKEGVNVGFNAAFPGAKTPALPDQVALTAEPPTTPFKITSSPSQITSSRPAETVAEDENEISILSVLEGQTPAGLSDVNVSVRLPALNSAAVGA